jgi:hypothetical protein
MAPQVQENPVIVPERRLVRVFGWLAVGVLLGVLLAVIATRSFLTRPFPFLGGLQKSSITDSTVVHQIRNLQRMESVVYTLDQIVTGERSYAMVPPSLAGDRILLIVHGEIIAGIDLAQLKAEDVKVEGHSVTVHLPAAQIFSTRLDNQKTRVYSRDTGLFSTPDPQLESEARRHAEEQLTAAALQDGILENAARNAKSNLVVLLHSLGFERVTIL